jgi:hypothetical protein
MHLQKVISKKIKFFICILKAIEEKSRIRIRICNPVVRIRFKTSRIRDILPLTSYFRLTVIGSGAKRIPWRGVQNWLFHALTLYPSLGIICRPMKNSNRYKLQKPFIHKRTPYIGKLFCSRKGGQGPKADFSGSPTFKIYSTHFISISLKNSKCRARIFKL